MATGLNRLGAAAYTNSPPAIVEQAKDWRYYEQAILNSEENTGKLYREYKEGGAWKAHYKTWEDACVPLGKPRRTVDSIIHRDRNIRQELPNVEARQEQKALSQVEKARETMEEKEEEEEEEKPAVHSADEKPRDQSKPQTVEKIKPAKDKSGAIIPQNLLELFNRRNEITPFMTTFARARKLLEALQTEKDPLFASIRYNGIVQTLAKDAEALYYAFRNCQPEIVCPLCDGGRRKVACLKDVCPECCGVGMIYEEKWNREWVKSNDRIKQTEVAVRAKNL